MKKLLYDVQEKRDGKWYSWGEYSCPQVILQSIEYHLEGKRRPELRAIPVFETVYHCK
jgi:hypothetical protein